MNTAEIKTWALMGAEHRLAEIAEEAKAIFRNFPELRRKGRGFEAAEAGDGAAAGRQPAAPVRRRRKLSAAARKRISDAVKARWARQRGEAAATQTGTPAGTEAKQPRAARKGSRRGRRLARKVSAQARKRMSEAQKARWAKQRKEHGDRPSGNGANTRSAAARGARKKR